MSTTKVIIQLTTHTCHVQVDSRGYISVFKHNNHVCAYEIFTVDQQWEASDFITEQLPSLYYSVTIHGDSPE